MGDKRAAMFGGMTNAFQYLNDLLIVELRRHFVVSVYTELYNYYSDYVTLIWLTTDVDTFQ